VRRVSNSLASHGLNEAIVRAFADGAWHSTDEVVAVCGHLIPPEIALRRLKTARSDTLPAPLGLRVERGRMLMIRAIVATLGAEPGGERTWGKWVRFRLPAGQWGREYGTQAGSTKPQSKLTEEQVREIRARYASGQATRASLGEEYGVHATVIGRIIAGTAWKGVA
jgi:hypothetical protein